LLPQRSGASCPLWNAYHWGLSPSAARSLPDAQLAPAGMRLGTMLGRRDCAYQARHCVIQHGTTTVNACLTESAVSLSAPKRRNRCCIPTYAGSALFTGGKTSSKLAVISPNNVGSNSIRRGNFCSVENLQEKFSNFIDFFNDTMAKPFRWTYTGKPLAA
jgi:hypothetical protein